MAEFAYNNSKNASIVHMFFELKHGYNPYVFFEDEVDFYSKSCLANELTKKLRKLMLICQQNLFHSQNVQK